MGRVIARAIETLATIVVAVHQVVMGDARRERIAELRSREQSLAAEIAQHEDTVASAAGRAATQDAILRRSELIRRAEIALARWEARPS